MVKWVEGWAEGVGLTWAAHRYGPGASGGPAWSAWGLHLRPQSRRGRHCGWPAPCPGCWSQSSAPGRSGAGKGWKAQAPTSGTPDRPLQATRCPLTSSTVPCIPYESPGGKWTSTREPSRPSQKKVWCCGQQMGEVEAPGLLAGGGQGLVAFAGPLLTGKELTKFQLSFWVRKRLRPQPRMIWGSCAE